MNRKANNDPTQLATFLRVDAAIGNSGANGATLLKRGDCPYWLKPEFSKLIKEDVIPLIDEVARQTEVGVIDPHTALSGKSRNVSRHRAPQRQGDESDR